MSDDLQNFKYFTSTINRNGKTYQVKSDKLYTVNKINGIYFEGDSWNRVNGKFASESTIDMLKEVGNFGLSHNTTIHVSGLFAPWGKGHQSHYTGDKSDIPIRNLDLETILELGELLADDPTVTKILYSGPGHEQLWKNYPNKFDKQTLINNKYLYDLHKTHFDIQTLNDYKYHQYKKSEIESGSEDALIINKTQEQSNDNTSDFRDRIQERAGSTSTYTGSVNFSETQNRFSDINLEDDSFYSFTQRVQELPQNSQYDNSMHNEFLASIGLTQQQLDNLFAPTDRMQVTDPEWANAYQTNSNSGVNNSVNNNNSNTSNSNVLPLAAGALFTAGITWTFGEGLSVFAAFGGPVAIVAVAVMLLNALFAWW